MQKVWGLLCFCPLHRLDPVTKERIEVLPFPKKRKKKRINIAKIKAWAYETTPVPDFSCTDFFLGLLPKGHLDRRMSPATLHDRSPRTGAFDKKLEAHQERYTPSEEEEKRAQSQRIPARKANKG